MHQSLPQKNRTTATGSWLWRVNFAFAKLTDQQIPHELLGDPETARRARLITHFGVLGSIFGLIYAAFYFSIGHVWGGAIVAACTIGVAFTPFLMRWTQTIAPAGNFFSLVLVLGFLGLCLCEGGLDGHAIAWLVSVPLCAMLLIGVEGALKWTILSLITAAVVAGLALAGIDVQPTYPPRWHVLISTAGYLGLIAFMSTLGVIFERGRMKAQARMLEAMQRLAESNQKLVALNAEKNEFLGIAAHDLKNPLTAILVNAELMRSEFDAQQVEFADEIITAAERMRNLITDLLDVNAIEEGRFASNLQPCDLAALVRETIKSNLTTATHKQIKLLTGEIAPLIGLTDHTAAQQILDNIISNAVKYSPHGATVFIDLTECGDTAAIRVRDQGVGLSEEDQKNLFKKYCRLSSKPTGGESSNGLGLAIAHRLAKALSGDIRCESKLGEGSTFILELPLPADGAVGILQRPIPATNAIQPDTADAAPPPPRHRVPAPPGPLAKKS